MNNTRPDTSIVIISVCGQRDIGSLLKALESCAFTKVSVMQATVPDFLSLELDQSNQLISPVEQAISNSHHRARVLSSSIDADWSIILEDDAIVLNNISNLREMLQEIEGHFRIGTPLAVHLSPEQFGLLLRTKSSRYYKLPFIADCAVGYAMNRTSVRRAVAQGPQINEVADWPKSFRAFRWFAPVEPMVAHPDLHNISSSSATLEIRTGRSNRRSIKNRIRKYPYFKMFIFKLFSSYSQNYGIGYVQVESLRSRIIGYDRNTFRKVTNRDSA